MKKIYKITITRDKSKSMIINCIDYEIQDKFLVINIEHNHKCYFPVSTIDLIEVNIIDNGDVKLGLV